MQLEIRHLLRTEGHRVREHLQRLKPAELEYRFLYDVQPDDLDDYVRRLRGASHTELQLVALSSPVGVVGFLHGVREQQVLRLSVSVNPGWRGLGVATALVRHALHSDLAQECSGAEMRTLPSNPAFERLVRCLPSGKGVVDGETALWRVELPRVRPEAEKRG